MHRENDDQVFGSNVRNTVKISAGDYSLEYLELSLNGRSIKGGTLYYLETESGISRMNSIGIYKDSKNATVVELKMKDHSVLSSDYCSIN